MTVPAPGRLRPRFLFPDWLWAIVCWIAGAGYFMLSVAVGTTFFFPEIPGPPLSALAVWGALVAITLEAAAIAWATRFPLPVFWIVFAAFEGSVLLTIDRALLVTPALLFAVFAVTALLSRSSWIRPLGIAVVLDLAIYLVIGHVVDGGLTIVAAIAVVLRVLPPYAFAVLAGLFYASQRTRAALEADRAKAVQLRAEAMEVATETTRTAAIVAERARIAREFHDIAAQHLQSIIVTGKAAMNLSDADLALIREALTSIRDESELAMRSIREVIGMLRQDGDDVPAAVAVAPSLRDGLWQLVDAARAADQRVEVALHGDVDDGDLSPAAVLACYRIVQESLTNARKHAPGASVLVRVARRGDSLTATVTNTPSTAPSPDPAGPRRPGFGLLGMRERAATVGGSLTSARASGGGWETLAILPMESGENAR